MHTMRLTLVLMLLATPAAAQTCTPQPILNGVANGNNKGNPGFAVGQTVPANEIWQIEAAGIGTDNQGNLTYADFSIGIGDGFKLTPIELAAVPQNRNGGTPMMALTRRLFLWPGTNLYARQNGLQNGENWYITYYGFRFPLACAERLLIGGAGSQTSTASPPPDFTALRTAALDAATAAQDVAAKLNTLAQNAP